MIVWPTDVWPDGDDGYEETATYGVNVVRGPQGVRSAWQLLGQAPVVRAHLRYLLDHDELATIEAAIEAVAGPRDPFYFFSFYTGRKWTGLDCGTGDGIQTVFPTPLLHPVTDAWFTPALTVAGSPVTQGVDWDWTVAGSIGEAQFELSPALAGALLLDAEGRLLRMMALVDDGIRFRPSGYDQTVIELDLEEVVSS